LVKNTHSCVVGNDFLKVPPLPFAVYLGICGCEKCRASWLTLCHFKSCLLCSSLYFRVVCIFIIGRQCSRPVFLKLWNLRVPQNTVWGSVRNSE
jgi:hypothetical protein